jgi:hypothetical protein
MKKTLLAKILILVVLLCGTAYLLTGCCQKCCSPSIEVGLINVGDTGHYHPDKISLFTWNPVSSFPANPTVPVSYPFVIDPLKPYLFKANITNFSDVEVRGVTVVFAWASFGLSDHGTPIGSVAVDLPASSSKWVNSPWTTIPFESGVSQHICIFAQTFHPCDTDLINNWCYNNVDILTIDNCLTPHYLPFTVDMTAIDGALNLTINKPANVDVKIVRAPLEKQMKMDVKQIINIDALKEINVQRDVPQDMYLIVDCSKSNYKPGDVFDITVTGTQKEKVISSFVIKAQILK